MPLVSTLESEGVITIESWGIQAGKLNGYPVVQLNRVPMSDNIQASEPCL